VGTKQTISGTVPGLKPYESFVPPTI